MELRRLFRLHVAPLRVTACPTQLIRQCNNMTPIARSRFDRAVIAIIFFAANAALFATTSINGDFSWSDAPRHALNGAFVKDMIAAAPWHDPKSWAINYYLQYPALTILFYPPLFYCFEAIGYAIFGVSHLVAQATVGLFTLLLGAATYHITRFNFPRWSALGATLLVIGGPETAFWARQVMLDVPAYAILVTGTFFYVRYVRAARPPDLYIAVIVILAAVYVKITAVFIAPVFAVSLVMTKGPGVLRDKHVIWAAILGVLGLIPAVLMTLKFGMINVGSVVGRSIDLPRTSITAWLVYAEAIPQYLGYIATGVAICGFILVLWRRPAPLDPWFAWLLVGWIVFGYLFFSTIGVREPRHGMMLAFPLIIFIVLVVHRTLPQGAAQATIASLGIATFMYSLIFYPPPRIEGYASVADYVALYAPKNAIVLFSGYRDGNFIFNLRTHEERRDIWTIRADKLLLRIAVERIRGVNQANLNEKQIADALREYGVNLVVFQPDFWTDLREMARLSAVLHTPDFERVASFGITGTAPHLDNKIEIYKPTYPAEQLRRALQLPMPIIGDTFEGNVGPH
jgi:4-amino-4-deoxy-L-arabinose transferase-like glycosyltransferase